MNNIKLLLPAFILIALVQLYVPASMIIDREDILNEGVTYKFKTRPIDPNDPFRGKYITLNFLENTTKIPDSTEWRRGEELYVLLTTDNEGFVKIQSGSKEKPDSGHDYLKVKVANAKRSNIVRIQYPFDRYYMEESKASEAETIYRESQRDTSQVTYAIVYIKDGEAVLNDVMIDDTSIKDLVKKKRDKQKRSMSILY